MGGGALVVRGISEVRGEVRSVGVSGGGEGEEQKKTGFLCSPPLVTPWKPPALGVDGSAVCM